jgi:glutamate--cysteine ligase catalytic subunit
MLGTLLTPAAWIRDFVQKHPSYKQDSVVSADINYDLLTKLDQIAKGELKPVGLLEKLPAPFKSTHN